MLLQYFDPTATAAPGRRLHRAVRGTPAGLKVLDKSSAEDKDAVVVTKETAEANNLKSIADLAPVASTFVLGGPSGVGNPADRCSRDCKDEVRPDLQGVQGT